MSPNLYDVIVIWLTSRNRGSYRSGFVEGVAVMRCGHSWVGKDSNAVDQWDSNNYLIILNEKKKKEINFLNQTLKLCKNIGLTNDLIDYDIYFTINGMTRKKLMAILLIVVIL